MDRLTELASKLTPTQLREVEDFAEFLTTRRAQSAPLSTGSSKPINLDAVVGMLANLPKDKSTKELIRESWEEIAAKYD